MTSETVCVIGHEGSGGPDIESEGANPVHEEGSPPRENEAQNRRLQDEPGTEEGEPVPTEDENEN